MTAAPPPAALVLVATPIGNLEDVTLRALRTLREADALACEDTRLTRRLLDRHGIAPPPLVLSCHEHNEEKAAERICELVASGRRVALCTDAGHPGVSDPGFRVVALAAERGLPIEAIPGPCAAVTALALSGLPTSTWTFLGFAPRKPGKLRSFLATHGEGPHTLVLYESPFRLAKLLVAARDALGDRRAAVCLELTKKFERVERGWLEELAGAFAGKTVKGEATVTIAGNHPKFSRAEPRLATAADDAEEEDDGIPGDGGAEAFDPEVRE